MIINWHGALTIAEGMIYMSLQYLGMNSLLTDSKGIVYIIYSEICNFGWENWQKCESILITVATTIRGYMPTNKHRKCLTVITRSVTKDLASFPCVAIQNQRGFLTPHPPTLERPHTRSLSPLLCQMQICSTYMYNKSTTIIV